MFAGLPLIIISASLAVGVPPLDDLAHMVLEGAADYTPGLDEPGLYVLLDNAADWSSDPADNEIGARIPHYERLRTDPAESRGELMLVEGTIESILDFGVLSKPGWEQARALTIRTERGGIVIVYLSHPPDLAIETTVGAHHVPAEKGRAVRMSARFFKTLRQPTQSGEPMVYPVFVGHSLRWVSTDAASSGGFATSLGRMAIVLVVVALFGGYVVVRIVMSRNRGPSPLEQRLARADAEADRPVDVVYRKDLPEDPAAALEALEYEHEYDTEAHIDDSAPDQAHGQSQR